MDQEQTELNAMGVGPAAVGADTAAVETTNVDAVDLGTIAAAAASGSSTAIAGAIAALPNEKVPGKTEGATANGEAGATEDLWGSILNSVQSSRGVPTKNVVVLGEPSTGKRTLLTSLSSGSHANFPFQFPSSSSLSSGLNAGADNPPANTLATPVDSSAAGAGTSPNPATAVEPGTSHAGQALLGLAYGYWDVADDDSEGDVLARVGAYTLLSSDPAYSHLLNYAFPPSASEVAESSAVAARKALGASTSGPSSSSRTAGNAGASTSAAATAAANAAALSAKPSLTALANSLILITLDWTQPQRFLEQLRRWLVVIRNIVDQASDGGLARGKGSDAGWSEKWAVLDEMREALEMAFRSYREPAAPKKTGGAAGTAPQNDAKPSTTDAASAEELEAAAASSLPATSLSNIDPTLQLPLSEGTLDSDSNWGVNLVVVCTKADTMNRLETERGFKEEQFDYVQQVLRVICLKYGAALFYISAHRPASVAPLRRYILHTLFERQQGSTSSASRRFPLDERPSTVDRDTVFVPSGWDSYGKIKALRGSEDTFDCAAARRSWENDFDVEKERRRKILAENAAVDDESLKDLTLRQSLFGPEAKTMRSAVELFEDIVGDWHAREPPVANQSKVAQPDIQAFLAQHYATQQKEGETSSASAAPLGGVAASTSSTAATGTGAGKDDADARAGDARSIMGPMAASGFSILPKMEDPDAAEDEALLSSSRSKSSRSDKRDRPRIIDTDALAIPRERSRPTSPSGSAGSPGVPKQSEVLQSFFQSLLKDKPVGSPAGKSRSTQARKTSQS